MSQLGFDVGLDTVEDYFKMNAALAFPMLAVPKTLYEGIRPAIKDLTVTIGSKGATTPAVAANTWQPTAPTGDSNTTLWLIALVATAGLTLYLARR